MRISDWSSDVCSSDLRYAETYSRHQRLAGGSLPHGTVFLRRAPMCRDYRKHRRCVAAFPPVPVPPEHAPPIRPLRGEDRSARGQSAQDRATTAHPPPTGSALQNWFLRPGPADAPHPRPVRPTPPPLPSPPPAPPPPPPPPPN